VSRYQDAHHTVEVTLDLKEPALVPAAFDLVRTYARAYGLANVGKILITLRVEFDGQTHAQHVDEFSDRLEQLWIGQITEHKVKEIQKE